MCGKRFKDGVNDLQVRKMAEPETGVSSRGGGTASAEAQGSPEPHPSRFGVKGGESGSLSGS